jgi:hypothetical protein
MRKMVTHRALSNRFRHRTTGLIILFVLIIIVLIVVGILANRHLTPTYHSSTISEDARITITDLVYNNSPTARVQFTLSNNAGQFADCTMILRDATYEVSRKISIIVPQSTRQLELRSPVPLVSPKVIPSCTFRAELPEPCRNSTFELCDQFLSNKLFEQCLGGDLPNQYLCMAVLSRNVSECDHIDETFRRVNCIAYITKKPELCANLSRWSDWCYMDLAINWRKRELCSHINATTMVRSCEAIIGNNISLCREMQNNTDCMVALAVAYANSSICAYATAPSKCYQAYGNNEKLYIGRN